jgi:glycosyltransferase involved in cell wall biosynthesis
MSRVGILAVSLPRYGGTYQYTLAMIEALRHLPEHDYTIFTSVHNDAYDLGLPLVRLPPPALAAALVAGAAAGLASRVGLFSEVDKVIAPIYSTYLLASSRPFAFTLHDLQDKHMPQNFTALQRAWRNSTNFLLTRAAARIICESSHVESDIRAFFPAAAHKVRVIAAPPLTTFSKLSIPAPLQSETVGRLQLPAQYLFYPAQFFPHKNHLRLIDAFAQVSARYPNCQLLLTGRPIHDYDKVVARIRERGLSGLVRLLGHLGEMDLAVLYKAATVVVIPTLFESISIPVYEAFTLGTPVCVSNVVALPEQVGDAAVLFDPYSVEDMAQRICATLADPQLRQELVERGRRRIAGMTMQRYAGQLGQLLSEFG